ncbi:glycosyltransferase family 4 protein [candidate division KSB1 bacterium]|nr:glycosyltransferase family 4 protein [candidate division KSB1 bacterium]
MRILFINSIRMYGGGEVWMITAAKELVRRGHELTIVCRPDAAMRPYAEASDARVAPMTIRGDFYPGTILRTRQLLQEYNIDIILTNMDKELRFAALAARLCHRPPVIARKGIDHPLKNKLHYRWTYNRLATAVIANSQATKQTLLNSAPWLDGDRVHVIYNGIDPELYAPERTKNIRSELGMPDDAPVIGFVGRLNVQKGIEYLLEGFRKAIEQIPTMHLLLVGEGNLHEDVVAFAEKHNLKDRIHPVGFRDDIPNVMRTIDLCVLPSLWEGFGIVLIEAMAAGKPCITTRISSMPEIVRDGKSGLVVPPRDPDALAVAIRTIMSDNELANQMGETGRQDVLEKYTISRMIEQYELIFQRYVSGKRMEHGLNGLKE